MDNWPQLIIFPDEDEETLKSEFISLCAKHRNTFSHYEVAVHVFRNLRDPEMRARQAADYWGKDLDVQERIRQAINLADDEVACGEQAIKRRLLAIADSNTASYKDKNDALKTLAQMQGLIVKPIEFKNPSNVKAVGLATFQFAVDPDADKPGEQVDN
jgi:hypothetical protein